MEKFITFLKKHKKKLIVIVVILIILLICYIAVHQLLAYLNPNTKESVYGDRCDLTESVMITDARKSAVKEAVDSYELMELSTVNVECNLINIIVNVENDVEESKIKEMADTILDTFDTEELKYYDLHLMVNWPDDDEKVMMATHHKMINGEMNDHFVW